MKFNWHKKNCPNPLLLITLDFKNTLFMAKNKPRPKGAVESFDELQFYFDGKDIAVDTLIESLSTFRKVCEEVMLKAEPDKKLA